MGSRVRMLLPDCFILATLSGCTLGDNNYDSKTHIDISTVSKINEDLQERIARLEDLVLVKHDFKNTKEQDDIEERVAKLEDLAKIGTLRSCYEYSQYGLKTNGPYMVDPDGGLVGQEPFQVYCNFKTGATEVMHDTEDLTEVEHCHDPGCYQKNI